MPWLVLPDGDGVTEPPLLLLQVLRAGVGVMVAPLSLLRALPDGDGVTEALRLPSLARLVPGGALVFGPALESLSFLPLLACRLFSISSRLVLP